MPEKTILFMPAYRAAQTLERVYRKIPKDAVDEMFLIDDGPEDGTCDVAEKLGLAYVRNDTNLGYGGNVKKCLRRALDQGGDILIELHPDDQYDPSAISAAVPKIREGFDFVLGSRFLNRGDALSHKMPLWKYLINRLSTLPARARLRYPLTDFHTGFRVYHRRFLESVSFENNHSDYLFSFEIIAQACFMNAKIAEVPVICRYFDNVTQINFRRSVVYGRGVLNVLREYRRAKSGRPTPLFTRPEVKETLSF